jgi:hypothetical protein
MATREAVELRREVLAQSLENLSNRLFWVVKRKLYRPLRMPMLKQMSGERVAATGR